MGWAMNMERKVEIDWKDKTAIGKWKCSYIYFFKGRYEDGYILAFWSHTPRGCVNDTERGWVLIRVEDKETGIIVDDVATCMGGWSTSEGREVLKDWRKTHGKIRYYMNQFGIEHRWKMWE